MEATPYSIKVVLNDTRQNSALKELCRANNLVLLTSDYTGTKEVCRGPVDEINLSILVNNKISVIF